MEFQMKLKESMIVFYTHTLSSYLLLISFTPFIFLSFFSTEESLDCFPFGILSV